MAYMLQFSIRFFRMFHCIIILFSNDFFFPFVAVQLSFEGHLIKMLSLNILNV